MPSFTVSLRRRARMSTSKGWISGGATTGSGNDGAMALSEAGVAAVICSSGSMVVIVGSGAGHAPLERPAEPARPEVEDEDQEHEDGRARVGDLAHEVPQ